MRYLFLPRGFCLCLHIFVIAMKYSSTSIKRLTSGCTSKLPLHGGWPLNRGLSWISIILSSKTTLFWNMRARGEALLIHNRSQLPSQTVFSFNEDDVKWGKYTFKLRYDRRIGHCNFGTSTGLEPMASALALAAVFYQLNYEDPYTAGSRPICWLHLNPWMEWNNEHDVNCENICCGSILSLV